MILKAIAEREPFTLRIITSIKGSSPQTKAANALFFADGRIAGTLGGGCLEAEVRERARLALLKQQPAAFELVLDHDFGWDDGLICGGKVAGLILPHAAEAGSLWSMLARREEIIRWGVKKDFSMARIDENGEWLYEESVSPPC